MAVDLDTHCSSISAFAMRVVAFLHLLLLRWRALRRIEPGGCAAQRGMNEELHVGTAQHGMRSCAMRSWVIAQLLGVASCSRAGHRVLQGEQVCTLHSVAAAAL